MIEALLQAERLLIHGQVDQAEQIYAAAVGQDPNNSIAMVGLARVALERGDDRLALERARAALVIDPQNEAAVRLESRLAEVMSSRADEPSSTPAPAPAPAPRPSEAAVFTRNPSMAEHQRMDETRPAQTPPAYDHLPPAERPAVAPAERKGLLRRLFGR